VPKANVPGAAELLEFVEQQPDNAADALVRVRLDLADFVLAMASQ